MSSKQIGIEDARKTLGDLVDLAAAGTDIILTRRGRPVATITAYRQEPSMILIYRDDVDEDFYEVNRPDGEFDAKTSTVWDGQGTDGRPERLWLTDSGYVKTFPGAYAGTTRRVTDDDAAAWFKANGLADSTRRWKLAAQIGRVDLPELTRRLGEPDHQQQAVLAWTGCDEGTTWTEAEAAELAEVWQADGERIAAER